MRLTELTMHNFRFHTDLTISLSQRTIVRGQNARGKSTIGEAVIWCLYGTDRTGVSKQDERLIRRGATEMEVALTCVTDAGHAVRIVRRRDKTQVLLVGGKRQGAQPKIEEWFGTLPEFLTMFTPGYFCALEPKSARAVVARCLPVLQKEVVLARLQPDHRALLSSDRYPMIDGADSLDFILDKTRREMNTCKEEQVRLGGEIRGLESVLIQDAPTEPTPRMTPEGQEERARLQALVQAKAVEAATKETRMSMLHAKRTSLRTQYEACKGQWQMVADTCPTCGQALQSDRIESLRLANEVKHAALRLQMDDLIGQGNAVKVEMDRLLQTAMDQPDVLMQAKLAQFQFDEDRDRRERAEYEAKRRVIQQAQSRIKEARLALDFESKRIAELTLRLQALEEYRFEYIRMQHDALRTQFTHVHLDLIDANRETGEVRSVFRILWKGRPYRTLSQSEKIRCDVEIGRAIAQARQETMPVFVDNAESVQHLFDEPYSGQVMAAYVDDCELKVEHLDEERVSA